MNQNTCLTVFAAFALLTSALSGQSVSFSGTAIANPLDNHGTPLEGGNLSLIIVDTARDGFAAESGYSLSGSQGLGTTFGNDDDVIVAYNASAAPLPGLIHQIMATAEITLGDGIDAGDPFAVVFFDDLSAISRTLTSGIDYGFAHDSSWVVPAAGSSYEFSIAPEASDFLQLSNIRTSNTLGIPVRSFLQWAKASWGDALGNSAGLFDDSDGDGSVNLVEYAFNLDPTKSDRASLPKLTEVEGPNGERYWNVEFERPATHTEASISLEFSDDMIHWYLAGIETVEIEKILDSETELVTMRIDNTSSDKAPLFMRYRVDSLSQ